MPARDLTLAPPPGFRLPPLGEVVAGVHAEPAEVLDLQATYHDTADLRLTRAGASLAHDGATWRVDLRGSAPGHGVHRFAGASEHAPAAALDLVAALTRGEPVGPVARLKTRRRRVRLANGAPAPVAEVLDDEVTVLEGHRITGRFREVDVVLGPDAPDALAGALLARLRGAGAGPAPPRAPLARALGPRGLLPPDVAPPAPVAPDAGVRTLVTATLARAVAHLVAHDPGVRLGEDPEAVHQARVATRRLRSDLRTFRDLLEPTWTRSLRDELRWLGGLLGAVRDVEVMRELLGTEATRLGIDERRIAAEMLDDLAVRRHEARLQLLAELRTPRYLRLLDRLVDTSRMPAVRPDATGPAHEHVAGLLTGPWRHLDRTVRALAGDPPDAALHELRVRTKRLRYACEAVAPVADAQIPKLARRAAALQDVLGLHHDAVVAAAWLREAAQRCATRPEAFTAGELAGLLRAEELSTRVAWPGAWRRLEKQARRVRS